jgi:hypothetical protein
VFCGAKRASYVLTPLAANQLRLITGVMNPLEGIGGPGSCEPMRDSTRNRIGMVEAPPAVSAGVKRDADDEIGSCSRLPGDLIGQLGCEVVDREADWDRGAEEIPSGFEAGDPSPNGAFIANERAAMVKSAAFGETAGTTFEYSLIEIAFIVGSRLPRSPAPWAAIHHAPPWQSTGARRTEWTRSRIQRCVAFDAARSRDGIQ